MTIQVPLKQQPPPRRRGGLSFSGSFGGGKGGGGFGGGDGFGGGGFGGVGDDEECDDEDWSMDVSAAAMSMQSMPMVGALSPPPAAGMLRSRACRSRGAPPPPVGKANAARVSRGSMADRVDKTVQVKTPIRDSSQHVTVTVVIYNTVAGGVPSAEDVKAAVDDMEALYASCGWKGRLASDGAAFMKKELTVKDAVDIHKKLTTQPYVPPAGEVGLVVGGDVFPSSSGAA